MREIAYFLYHCNLHPLSKMIPKSSCVSESLEKRMKIQIQGYIPKCSDLAGLGVLGIWVCNPPHVCTDCIARFGRRKLSVPFKSRCVHFKALCDIFVVPHFGISIFFLLGINGESR